MMDEAPIYCFVLVRADEGTTQEIVVAHGRGLEALADVIADMWTVAIAACDGPRALENQATLARERWALLGMLEAHPSCTPGRYVLPSVPPIWEQCTLVITEQDGAWFPD